MWLRLQKIKKSTRKGRVGKKRRLRGGQRGLFMFFLWQGAWRKRMENKYLFVLWVFLFQTHKHKMRSIITQSIIGRIKAVKRSSPFHHNRRERRCWYCFSYLTDLFPMIEGLKKIPIARIISLSLSLISLDFQTINITLFGISDLSCVMKSEGKGNQCNN